MPILAICSSTRSIQSFRAFRDGTNRQTHRKTTHGHRDLKTELAQRADSVKIQLSVEVFNVNIKCLVCSVFTHSSYLPSFWVFVCALQLPGEQHCQLLTKTPAHGRHWISQPMRIAAPIPKKKPKLLFKGVFFSVFLPLMFQGSAE